MGIKFSIKVGGKKFDVSLEDDEFFKECIETELSLEKDNDIKTLLHAYIKKCFEYHKLKAEIDSLMKKLEKE